MAVCQFADEPCAVNLKIFNQSPFYGNHQDEVGTQGKDDDVDK